MFHKDNPVMRAVRDLDPGGFLILPVSSWAAARAAASTLARDYGSRYEVHRRPRMGPTIYVERFA